MKNITFAIDDGILHEALNDPAHKRATVSATMRDYLAEIAGRDEKPAEARKQNPFQSN